jgi:DNA-binding NarL/FixJ family response regulator
VIRVLLADDQALVRAGFRFIAGSAPDIEVVGEAAEGAAAVDLARSLRAEVVLMDIRMPGTDGLEATRQIAADPELSGVRVIILTTFEADEYVFEAIRAGASGFLVKDTEPEDLISAIRVVARGDALLSPSVTRTLISSIAGRGPAQQVDASVLSVLTDREREVLARVAAGMSNDQIAAALFMSPLTAKTHVNRMMAKLSARDRAQLVVIAYETGLVRPGLSLRHLASPAIPSAVRSSGGSTNSPPPCLYHAGGFTYRNTYGTPPSPTRLEVHQRSWTWEKFRFHAVQGRAMRVLGGDNDRGSRHAGARAADGMRTARVFLASG